MNSITKGAIIGAIVGGLIGGLAAYCADAKAEIIGTSRNQAGGVIALFDDVFSCPDGSAGYAVTDYRSELIDTGCYLVQDDKIFYNSWTKKNGSGFWRNNLFEVTPYGVSHGWSKSQSRKVKPAM